MRAQIQYDSDHHCSRVNNQCIFLSFVPFSDATLFALGQSFASQRGLDSFAHPSCNQIIQLSCMSLAIQFDFHSFVLHSCNMFFQLVCIMKLNEVCVSQWQCALPMAWSS